MTGILSFKQNFSKKMILALLMAVSVLMLTLNPLASKPASAATTKKLAFGDYSYNQRLQYARTGAYMILRTYFTISSKGLTITNVTLTNEDSYPFYVDNGDKAIVKPKSANSSQNAYTIGTFTVNCSPLLGSWGGLNAFSTDFTLTSKFTVTSINTTGKYVMVSISDSHY